MDSTSRIKIKTVGKNNLILNHKSKAIKLKLKNVHLRFGIEKYNKKHILNMYIDPKDENYSNEDYNKVMELCNCVKKVGDLVKNPLEARRLRIDNKGFQSPIKDAKEGKKTYIVLRTYLSYNAQITINDMWGTLGFDTDISNYRADVDVVIKTLWKTSNNYGIIVYTTGVNLLHRTKKKEKKEESSDEDKGSDEESNEESE